MTRFASALLVAVALASCASPTDASRHIVMRSSATSYVAQSEGGPLYSLTVVIRLENTGRRALELEQCSPEAGGPLWYVGSEEEEPSAYNGAWGCPASAPLIIAPGEVREDSLRLIGPSRIRQGGEPIGALSGTMFIGYMRGNRRYVSNTFAVELPTP